MIDLLDEELDAIKYLAARHGPRWKRELRKIWESGNANTATERILYSLRNTKGPTWLSAFSLTKARRKGGVQGR